MIESLKKLYKLVAVFAIACCIMFFVLITPVLITNDDFSIYNAAWNGCSKFAKKTLDKSTLLPTLPSVEYIHLSITNYKLTPSTSAIVILGPTTPFTDTEAKYIEDFLQNGGLLLIADDFGTANTLLSKLNTKTRFANSLLVDFAFEKSFPFTVVFKFKQHQITNNLTAVMLNYPTALIVGENASVEILANSTMLSWLDTNLNAVFDEGEIGGELPVVCIEKYRRGEILFVADPSLFINSMQQYLDNSIFVDNVLAYLSTGRSAILIDESHRASNTPTRMVFVAVGGLAETTKYILVAVIIGVVIAILIGLKHITTTARAATGTVKKLILKLLRRKAIYEKMTVVDKVLAKHPGWDRKLLEKLASEIDRNSRITMP